MEVTYRLPFPDGTEWEEARPRGTFAHENFPESRYARDFRVEEGTQVLAARAGKIVKIKSDSNRHFNPNELNCSFEEVIELAKKYTNYVGIDHGDGTYAEYLHLDRKVAVKEGQEVKQGDVIGYVGLTGILDAPHLHMNAFKIENGKAISIPFEIEESISDA
jgi:murein DD-endopeptidase MepM/ murein hydrolase activator NlpD